ncbi:ribonuclease H-like domain-containing protein [Tanacetum coccineum]|uniref:Ribonuclease H-like domain-containing protein n=1 Tax=Tanacetum coccineum TaxID=301880 RepID=A0ABQ5GBM5_9ASTR
MWIFLHKYLADGTLSGYKARLVVNGSTYSSRIFLSSCKYATEILERAGMVSCNSSMTSVDTESKLGDDGDLVSNPILYRSLAGSLKQSSVSRSSVEAEYRGVANVVAETCWLRNLLYLVAAGQVRVLHVHSRYQYVDIYTKGLPSALFEEFDTSLSVRCPLTPTAGHNIEDEEKHPSLLLHSSLHNPKGNVSAVPKPRGLAATGQKKAPAKNKSLERRWSLEDSLDELEVVVVVECEVSLENKVMMECYIVMEEVEVECDCHLEVKVEIEHEAY